VQGVLAARDWPTFVRDKPVQRHTVRFMLYAYSYNNACAVNTHFKGDGDLKMV